MPSRRSVRVRTKGLEAPAGDPRGGEQVASVAAHGDVAAEGIAATLGEERSHGVGGEDSPEDNEPALALRCHAVRLLRRVPPVIPGGPVPTKESKFASWCSPER